MPLVSGRKLFYHNVERDTDGYSYTTTTGRARLYGGKLFQHQCQAVAADILADRAVAIECKAHLLLTVHDEFALSVPENDTYTDIINVLVDTPSWAKGLPLAVDYKTSRRYRK
jgi:DNA polymerase